MSGDVDYAHTRAAEENRDAKAKTLARLAWRYALTGADVSRLDAPQRRAFAREAEVNPPSDASPTWKLVREHLDRMREYAKTNAPPAQDLAGERGEWGGAAALSDGAWLAGAKAPIAGAERPAETPGSTVAPEMPDDRPEAAPAPASAPERTRAPILDIAPHPFTPKGWDELVAAVDVLDVECTTCRAPAIVRNPNGAHCPNHPPQPGQWGSRLNYAPMPTTPCLDARCYCGRCEHYQPWPTHTPTPETRRTR